MINATTNPNNPVASASAKPKSKLKLFEKILKTLIKMQIKLSTQQLNQINQ